MCKKTKVYQMFQKWWHFKKNHINLMGHLQCIFNSSKMIKPLNLGYFYPLSCYNCKMTPLQFLALSHMSIVFKNYFKPKVNCCNPNMGSRPWQRLAKVWAEGSPWNTSHALGNVGKCEGTNIHTPKWAPILGVGVLMNSQIFREWLQGSKLIRLKSFLYH
jgi:hypothetical protein